MKYPHNEELGEGWEKLEGGGKYKGWNKKDQEDRPWGESVGKGLSMSGCSLQCWCPAEL